MKTKPLIKTCYRCHTEKPSEDFKDYGRLCKKCNNEISKAFYENPDNKTKVVFYAFVKHLKKLKTKENAVPKVKISKALSRQEKNYRNNIRNHIKRLVKKTKSIIESRKTPKRKDFEQYVDNEIWGKEIYYTDFFDATKLEDWDIKKYTPFD